MKRFDTLQFSSCYWYQLDYRLKGRQYSEDSVLLKSHEVSSDAVQGSLIDFHPRQTLSCFQYDFLPPGCRMRLGQDWHDARTSFINYQVAPFHFCEISEIQPQAWYDLPRWPIVARYEKIHLPQRILLSFRFKLKNFLRCWSWEGPFLSWLIASYPS